MDVNVLKESIESQLKEIENEQEKSKNNFKSQPNNLPNQSISLSEDCILSISSPAATNDNQQLKLPYSVRELKNLASSLIRFVILSPR